MNRPGRQLLIGLDAMEWDLVRRWAGSGELPAFARMIRAGFSAELETTAAQLPDTVWASIYCGVNPAKFQKYFYIQYDAATGDLRHVSDDEVSAVPFWEHLSSAGRRVAVLDAPKFRLSSSLNGIQLTNWGAHATKTERAASPPSLLQDLERRFSRHPVGDCDKVDDNPKSLSDLRARIINGVRLHGEVFRWLLGQEPWDVFFANFSAPHCIGHHFWYQHETASNGMERGDAIKETYIALDEEIGKLIDMAGPDTQTMVFSGHGMGRLCHASWNLSEILDLLGYGRVRSQQRPTAGRAQAAQVNPWRSLKLLLPGKFQYAIKAMLPNRIQEELLFRWYAGSRDWKGRVAFAVPNNDSVGAIRINLKGRDRYGIVEPADYARVCDEIVSAIAELVDPVSGRSVIRNITRLPEAFHGPYLSNLPDLTVLWEQAFPWFAVSSPRIGTLNIRRQDGRSGTHTPHGFILALGPGIAPAVLERRSIYDIAPTILAGAGVPIPPELDGSPIPLRSADISGSTSSVVTIRS